MSERDLVFGMRAVAELLEQRHRQVERVYVALERRAGLGRLLRAAREAGVPVSHVPRQTLARRVGRGAAHQGIAAVVAPLAYADADELCRAVAGKPDGLLVLADRVVDPRNLGAIVRTCAAAGVDGCLLGIEEAAGLTPTAVKAAAGAVERVPIAREPRPGRRLAALRARGFRAFALDARGSLPWDHADLRGPLVLVAGGEEKGPRRATLDACDGRIAIPLARGVESLNVAVALGVLLFEAVRQRRAAGGGDGA
jgi:23S rRNA (guanosine2251-2'-O)-methyltransferase